MSEPVDGQRRQWLNGMVRDSLAPTALAAALVMALLAITQPLLVAPESRLVIMLSSAATALALAAIWLVVRRFQPPTCAGASDRRRDGAARLSQHERLLRRAARPPAHHDAHADRDRGGQRAALATLARRAPGRRARRLRGRRLERTDRPDVVALRCGHRLLDDDRLAPPRGAPAHAAAPGRQSRRVDPRTRRARSRRAGAARQRDALPPDLRARASDDALDRPRGAHPRGQRQVDRRDRLCARRGDRPRRSPPC